MTVDELIRAFQSELHQRDADPVADTADILHYLNKAQEEFVLDKFAGSGSSALGFEESQDLRDDLRVFFEKDCRTETIYAGSDAQVGDFEVDQVFLPDDYLHLVSARAEIRASNDLTRRGKREDLDWTTTNATFNGETYNKRIAASGQTTEELIVGLRITQSQSVYEELFDPFHTSSPKAPLCDLHDGRINVYAGTTFLVYAVIMNYIREPKEIVRGDSPQTSELPESLHRDLVDRAVTLFLKFAPQPQQQ